MPSGAASHEDVVTAEVEGLAGLKLEELRQVWLQRFGAPPRLRSADLLRRYLAERIQMQHFGFDRTLEKALAVLVRSHRSGKTPPLKRPTVRLGTTLIREWGGETHRVEAVDGGFLWRGEKYRSLSLLARRITGARWNGPRFFGLERPG
jgi:hypothetical protein